MDGTPPAASDTPRVRLAKRRLTLALVSLVVLIGVIVVAGIVISRQINDEANRRYVEDAIPLKADVQDLILAMTAQQAEVRGYIITAAPARRDGYRASRARARADLAAVSGRLDGHPILAGLIERARPQISALETYYAQQVARVDRGDRATAVALVPRGAVLFERFDGTSALMLDDTDKFVRDARASQDARSRFLTLLLIGVGGGALVLAGILAFAVPRGEARLLGDLEEEREAATRAQERTARLQDMTAAVAVASTRTEVAQAVLERGRGATGAAAGSIALLDRDGAMLTTFGLVGYTEAIARSFPSYPMAAPLPIPDSIREGPIFLRDAAAVVARYPDLGEFHAGSGHQAVAALPLAIDGRAIGGLTISFAGPRSFDAGERAYLATVAELCAQAIDRARLYENEHREAERQQFLAEASALLTTPLQPRATLRALAELAVPTLGDWCSVMLAAGDRIETVAVAHRDPAELAAAEDFRERHPSRSEDTTGPAAVMRTGRSEFIPDITEEFIDAAIPPGERRVAAKALGLVSAMTVPLLARGRTLGALSLLSAESGRRFDADDLRFAEDLAARAGVAIDNVQLYERSRQIAATLQQSLLPPVLPEIAGLEVTARYAAAGEGIDVGGDFYDLFTLPHGAGWAAVLGDVCGKGPDAAALTALARYTIRAEADALSPATILSRLNEAVLRQRGDGSFLTASYVWLMPNEGGLAGVLGRGGHTPALIRRSSGSVETLVPRGSLVGVLPDAVFVEQELTLAVGDALVLYSDGVTESRSADGGEFGIERLVALLEATPGPSAEAIARAIEAAIADFRAGSPRDDIALLVISVAGPTPIGGPNGDGHPRATAIAR